MVHCVYTTLHHVGSGLQKENLCGNLNRFSADCGIYAYNGCKAVVVVMLCVVCVAKRLTLVNCS